MHPFIELESQQTLKRTSNEHALQIWIGGLFFDFKIGHEWIAWTLRNFDYIDNSSISNPCDKSGLPWAPKFKIPNYLAILLCQKHYPKGPYRIQTWKYESSDPCGGERKPNPGSKQCLLKNRYWNPNDPALGEDGNLVA